MVVNLFICFLLIHLFSFGTQMNPSGFQLNSSIHLLHISICPSEPPPPHFFTKNTPRTVMQSEDHDAVRGPWCSQRTVIASLAYSAKFNLNRPKQMHWVEIQLNPSIHKEQKKTNESKWISSEFIYSLGKTDELNEFRCIFFYSLSIHEKAC